jgi:hypothetical protein
MKSHLQGDDMKRLLMVCMLVATSLSGCAQNHFNVPAETFAGKVKAIGIAPILLDKNSDIRHPQRNELISLLAETNRSNEQHFVRKLKATGNFYTVAFLDSDPQNLFNRFFFRHEMRDDASIQYNKYFWKNDELRNYIQKNNLDAVMLITVSGLTKKDKVTSITQMKSMSSDYNYLIMTAQIIDASGAVLWEYPNFRQRILEYEPMLNLEYPDFSEAEANLSSSAHVKFRTIDGIRRILTKKGKDLLLRDTQEAEAYGKQFDEMLSLLKFDSSKDKAAPQTAGELSRPAAASVQPARAPESQPPAAPAPRPSSAPLDTLPPTDEIVPAKGSTL